MDDPRPERFRGNNGYNSFVRSQVINYCAVSSKDLAFRYLMPKANIQVAARDHDYTTLPMTEHWVDTGTKVSSMEEVLEIEETTKKQSVCKKWHQERRWRLTSSRFGEICKATDRRNKEKLCQSIFRPARLTSPAIIHGQTFERAAIKIFEEINGITVNLCGLRVDIENNFLAASPDGITSQGDIVEIKCPYKGRNNAISVNNNFPFLGKDENGDMHLKQNHNYFYQIQGQLNICKKQRCFFVVYTFKDIFVEEIYVDNYFWSGSMLPKLELFYQKYYRKFVAGKM
ncbi:uncharacterized protein LOC117326767 isoform X1 [Pecten maximus]|uniref:uncharacterized protein LOC117326767 isoform X1 n=1 Tax=Pecten maximus TaxID=6579 RepID=UPI001458A0DD|nr:uncharacterized protein LOC117326767 isoform X1 [Pecten maximus]XP_033739377.1 uncharacterized protein LOC117326767 isoform X1 [Pecten maximus]XP_033739378.1 uncharacterized protein LOC117326767 isoform X1 [Pecten maximus]XP_033739379.1 uncharacterized protein LOC117326767 isoform X1 [Pecten maximus]